MSTQAFTEADIAQMAELVAPHLGPRACESIHSPGALVVDPVMHYSLS